MEGRLIRVVRTRLGRPGYTFEVRDLASHRPGAVFNRGGTIHGYAFCVN